MDFAPDEIQQMLIDSAARLVGDWASVEAWRAHRALPDGLDPRLWRQIADLGWLGLAVPEEAGGVGGTMMEVALVCIELGRGLVVEPFVSTAVLGTRLLERAGGARARLLLGDIAAGEARIALVEGDQAHLGASPIVVSRTPHEIEISGRAVMVFDAPSATHLLVRARIDGDEALLLVDTRSTGMRIDSYPLIDGTWAADVMFEGFMLSPDAVLTRGPHVGDFVDEALDRATVALIAQAVGAMEACLATTTDYLRQRHQFGQPIGRFQALQHLAVDMLVASHQTRSILYQALAATDESSTERRQAVSRAKLVAGESMRRVSRTGVQLHGGYGVTDEYAVSHYFRRLLAIEKVMAASIA